MRVPLVFELSLVLFKSYLRASGSRTRLIHIYAQPRIMIIGDLIALAIPFCLLQYILPQVPEVIVEFLKPVVLQSLIGLPTLLTSAIIVAGMMFELGQSAGLSSSEAVNWLPISPREYVVASAISMITVYSPFFAVSVGITLPLALKFSLMHVWPVVVILSALALFLGAFIVEILRAVMNRVSSSVYRRSGRFGVVSRLVLLVVIFVIIQLAFNPYVLYSALGVIVSGIGLIWFIPMIWPSVAITYLIKIEMIPALIFSALSISFILLIFEAASNLRLRYWSPAAISITITSSPEYVPHDATLSKFGFSLLEASIALKEFRALVRRKDMARFIAIPIVMIVALILPTLFTPAGYSGRSPGLFLAAFIPFMVPLMFSSVTFGQEGKAVVNLYMLPISAKQLIKGKLLPTWIISTLATLGAVVCFEIVAPMGVPTMFAAVVAGMFVVMVESFIGLGVGARYPDYAVGPRSRYVTFRGFIIGLSAGGASTAAIFAPAALHLLSSGNLFLMPTFSITATLLLTLSIGSILSYLAYRYCKSGVEKRLSNLET